ncbi:hypothetical protein GY45DRAFT_1322894 [Cubamyces sp. BRFM 1775]|nr:hypothetical protein GY45DRAFT_1322894 [Cubamyces sp. BRFM 1775]
MGRSPNFLVSEQVEQDSRAARSPRTRSRSRPQRRHLLHRSYDKQITVLVVVLFTAGLASLTAAYYFYVTTFGRSTTIGSLNVISLSNAADAIYTQANLPTVSSENPSASASENFLAYLPHSGFHNQRIALENALVLARVLNRTLLLPPVRLGVPLSYAPFDELYRLSANGSKATLGYCQDIMASHADLPLECEEYSSYTHIPWEWLVNLTDIRLEQRLLEGWNFTDAWLEGELGVSADDIFYLKDTARNEYLFQDFFSLDPPARKFFQSVNIGALARRPERLIQLGTLFGSSRLYLRSAANYDLRKHVREQMAFTNPQLSRAADAIRDALGGSYLGVHLRIGDGHFEWNAPENIRLAWWKLLHLALGFSDEEILALEQQLFPEDVEPEPPSIKADIPALRTPHPPLPTFPVDATPSSRLSCRARLHSSPQLKRLNAPVFISTDAESTAFNPLLFRFTRSFPCSFFLEDFPHVVSSLGELKSPVDGVPLGPFLTPFLDAMVVGQAWQFVGTEHSTFSTFVADVLWRRYHGFEIVQRG